MMSNAVIWLMLITLNAHTGEELSRKIKSGPYFTEQECIEVQRKTSIQRTKLINGVNTITVEECAISHIDQVD